MNTLTPGEPAHSSKSLVGCFDCHGNDYSGPTAHNVHNPGSGVAKSGLQGEPWR